MSAVVSERQVSAGRTLRLPNGGEYVKRVYVGQFEKPITPDPLQAQIYSVGQFPGTVVDTHYHAVEQWQVFVDGSGTLGRHSALPGALHYVDRYTGYGPIVAGPRGLTYFTIRAMSDPGAQFLDRQEARAFEGEGICQTLPICGPYRAELAGVVVESTYNWYWLVDRSAFCPKLPPRPATASIWTL